VSAGEPCSVGHGDTPLVLTIPRAVPVAVIDGTQFLELAARLLDHVRLEGRRSTETKRPGSG